MCLKAGPPSHSVALMTLEKERLKYQVLNDAIAPSYIGRILLSSFVFFVFFHTCLFLFEKRFRMSEFAFR
jgi:hypothetical protein